MMALSPRGLHRYPMNCMFIRIWLDLKPSIWRRSSLTGKLKFSQRWMDLDRWLSRCRQMLQSLRSLCCRVGPL